MNSPAMVSGGLPIIGHGLEMLRDSEVLFMSGYAEFVSHEAYLNMRLVLQEIFGRQRIVGL